MKRMIFTLLLTLLTGIVSAQNPYFAMLGIVVDADGQVTYTQPHTTLAVDVTVECRSAIAGPYARYAQKCIGVRAPLTDRVEWQIVKVDVALVPEASTLYVGDLPADTKSQTRFAVAGDDYAAFGAEKINATPLTDEEAAQAAATRLFSLRQHRQELITGEAGENVFGAGLQAALDEIARQEQELLELFLGRQEVKTASYRYQINPESSKLQYIVCRYSREEGVLPASDLMGDMILLQIVPEEEVGADVIEAGVKETATVECVVANRAVCKLSVAGKEYVRKVLPIFEFGRKFTVSAPRRK